MIFVLLVSEHKGNRTLSPYHSVHHLHLAYIEGIEPSQVNFSVT